MENGDGSNFVEKRAVEVEPSDSKVAGVVPDGSKDLEGDEIFEETEMEKLGSADALLNEDQSAAKIETLGVCPAVEQNISVPDDFKDAAASPIDPDDFQEAAASSTEEQTLDFENVGVVEVASETVNGDEVSGSEKSELPDHGVNEVMKISHSDAASETEVLNNGDGVDGQSENEVKNKGSVNGDFDKQEIMSNEKLETQDANALEGLLTDSHPDITTGVGVSHPAENNMEENEKSTFPHTHQHNSGEQEDALALPRDHQADNSEDQKGNLVNQNTELKYSDSSDLNEESSVTLHPVLQDNRVEGQIDTSVSLNPQDQDGRSPKLKDLVTSESENHGNRTIQENDTVEKHEKIIASTSDLEGDQDADASVDISDGIPVTEKKAVKDEEVKHNNLESKEQKTQPAAGVPSLPEKSVNSTSNPARPAGLGRAAPLLEHAARVMQQPRVNGTVSPMQNQLVEDPANGEAEENDETREKLQMIRVKFLRLAHRLGQTPHNVVVAQVLYRLGLAEQLRGRNGGRVAAFSFDRASALAEQLEAAGQEPLDFSCTIMVLGKTGVGKSATINSIFDEIKFDTDAFQTGTKTVQDVVGTVQGIKVRVIDTPGLLPSWSDQRQNEKILHSVKRFIKKTPPDIVLYLDRLDMQSRDFGDMPLLRTITEIFGPSIWFNAIVVLTHAASAPPEGQNGIATGYDMFVTQRSHVVQQAIRQAAGDMRLMNPVSLVENHSACRTNRAGQRVLPNGQVWKPHLLLLSFASKILAEANTLLKLQDNPPGKPFAARARAPPLPFLLSSLLQSRSPVKLPSEQFGDDDDALNDDLDESSDSDDESEYDELPPFKPLTKAQIAKLSKAQKKAYYDELEYREKLFMKKQLKEEKKRRRMMKKMEAVAKELPSDYNDNIEEEAGGAASVPVPMPDLALPVSFDSDNPTHRYRCLDSMNQWLVRPVLDPNGWDHDVGYEGINAERLFVIKDSIPISFSGQVTKDKKDANVVMELASSIKHGEGKSTSLGFDMQSIGKDIAYTVRSDTRFSNYTRNKATAGLSATVLGDVLTAGVKVEDKFIVNKQGQVVVSGGAIVGRGDIAYGGSLEATLRDKDHPLGRFLSTFGLSVMDWHGDLAIGWNGHIQIPVGRYTNLIGRVNLNNRGSGQVTIRLNSSEQLQIALVSLLPIVRNVLAKSQQVQYGQ